MTISTIIQNVAYLVIPALIIFFTIKIETYLENKINEVAGWRTDVLFITSIGIVSIAGIFIAVRIVYCFLNFVNLL